MIIDVNCWTGPWPTHPLPGEPAAVRESLRRVGVERICLAPLSGVLAHNQHVGNAAVYRAADRWEDVLPVPVIDPTLATWPEEVDGARRHGRVRLVKWLPQYGRFAPHQMRECAAALAEAGLGLVVQIRLEDARRQHPLAVVEDADAESAVRLARQHPSLVVVLGGASFAVIQQQSGALRDLPNLYADVSQADGLNSVEVLRQSGLTQRLLFGSHAPFFVPLAGIARIVSDVDDSTAAAILGANAAGLLGLAASS